MRHALAIGGLIFIGIIVIPGLWLAHKSNAALTPGVLTAQIDKIIGRWNAENAPSSGRAVDLIISDARGTEAVKEEKKSKGYSSEDLEVLSSAQKPSMMARLSVWFRRTLWRRSMSAGDMPARVKALSNTPGAAVWVHRGEETVSEGEMIEEIKRAVIKAFDAGAKINIITEGPAAAAVLKAIKMVKEEKRPYGKSPVVSKIIAVDVNRATLKGMDHDLFSEYAYSDLAEETVFIWNPPLDPKKTTVELFTHKNEGKRFNGTELCAMMDGGGTEMDKTLRLIEEMGRTIYPAEKVLEELAARADRKKEAALAEERKKTEAVPPERWKAKPVTRDLMGRTYDREQPAAPLDSLSAISGGSPEKGTKKQTRQAENSSGNAANCTGRPYPNCNWWDAMAFCRGGLPSVNELKRMYDSECSGGGNSFFCGKWFWSSDEVNASRARYVDFSIVGMDFHSAALSKKNKNYVRCR